MKIGRALYLLMIVVFSLVLIGPAGPAVATPGLSSAEQDARLGDRDLLPFSFVPNRGQFDEGVRFVARGARGTFFFTPQEVAVVFSRPNSDSPIEEFHVDTDLAELTGNQPTEHLALRIRLAGASSGTMIEGLDPLPGTANYYVGDDPVDWQQGLPTYATILYRDLYPHTDVRYYGSAGRLKYDFLLHPGADATQIGLVYDGAKDLRVNELGQLVIATPWGDLVDEAPLAWQDGRTGKHEPVEVQYTIRHGNHVGFQVGAHDPTRLLVIDPSLNYSTFVGGSAMELCHSLALDDTGNAVVTGSTASTDFPTSYGAYDTGHNGSKDIYVFKLSSDGSSLLYSTFVGGSLDEESTGLTLDSAGNVIVTGNTWSSDFPTTPGAYDRIYRHNRDGFVFRLSSDGGSLLSSTFLGGSERDTSYAAAFDGLGNVVVSGYTTSPDFPTSPQAYDTVHNGGKDAYILKLSNDFSSLAYGTFLGGSGDEIGRALALDTSGNVIVTGYTWSPDFPTSLGAYDRGHNGGQDAYASKLSADGGSLLFSTYLGGSGDERGKGVALDDAGNAVLAGYTASLDFPTTIGAYDRKHRGGDDVFVLKLIAGGSSVVYATLVGGQKDDKGQALALDEDGNALVAGSTASSDFPTTARGYDRVYNGNGDVAVLKLSADGSVLVYSTFVGGADGDQAFGVRSIGTDSVVVAGRTGSSDFPTTGDAYDRGLNGDDDTFVLRLDGLEQGVGYYLSVNTVGNGTVVKDPDQTIYDQGVTVRLTAIAQAGWVFDRWGGSLSGSSNPTTINMDANKPVTAYFTQVCYTLTAGGSPGGSGWVAASPSPNCGGGQYISGTQVQLMANAGSGYRFEHWGGNASGNSNPTTVTMDRSKSVVAFFVEHGNGHLSAVYLPLILRVYPLVTVVNGGFETGDLTGWQTRGDKVLPAPQVVTIDPYRGNHHLLLGDPSYCNAPQPDKVGDHRATASQSIYVPDIAGKPMLTFWYRIFTYDHLTYTDGVRLGDSLDVYVEDQLALRDNYENYPNSAPKCQKLQDSDWRTPGNPWFKQGPEGLGVVNQETLDLTEWKGRSVEVRFELHTRHDGWYNTWAYLDDVSLSVSSAFNGR